MKTSSKVGLADANADHGGGRAIADFDDVLTALHELADEILPRRPRAGRRPRITLSLERHGAHTMTVLISRIAQRLLVLAACLWHDWNIGDPGHHLSAYDH